MKKTLSLILCVLTVLTSCVFAAPVMVGTVEDAGKNEVNAFENAENNDLAEVAAETSYDVPEGSKLVFHATYDNTTDAINKPANKWMPYGEGKEEAVGSADINLSHPGTHSYASSTPAYGATKADDAAVITYSLNTSGRSWPILNAKTPTGTYFADGQYTFCVEVVVPADAAPSEFKYVGYAKGSAQFTPGDKHKFSLNVDGTKNYITTNLYVYGDKVYGDIATGTGIMSASVTKGSVNNLGILFDATGTAGASCKFILDDFKMYYKPLDCAPGTANIYFDANGKTVENLPATVNKNVGTVDISTFVKLSDVGTSRFVGWSDKKDGKILASYDLQKSTTLYAIWDDYYYAPEGEGKNDELVFASHFNSTYTTFSGKLVSDTKISSVGPALSKISTDTVSFGSGTSRANYELKDISNADDELVLTTKGTNASETWPALWLNAKSPAVLADGIYTWYAELSVKADNELEYIKFNPAASCKLSGTNKNLSGSKFDLPVDGTKIYATITAAIDNGKVYFGTNLTKFSGTYDAKTLYRIGWNFNVKAKTGTETNTKIFIDNLRVYYRPIHKALSYDENSIRVNSPAGIRFKSSVSKLTREEATLTEYGFIVTRKAILDAKGVNEADFTMENEAMTGAYVKGVSYGVENGKKVDRIFESDSVNTFFTAAVCNIPADKYNDVIVVRPFVKIGEEIIYSEPMAASILEVANRIASSEDYENFKETVDKILNGEEI